MPYINMPTRKIFAAILIMTAVVRSSSTAATAHSHVRSTVKPERRMVTTGLVREKRCEASDGAVGVADDGTDDEKATPAA